MACSAVMGLPVTLEMKARRGACRGTLATTCSSCASRGSVMAECEATAMCSRRAVMSRERSTSSAASMAASGPDSTHRRSPLTAPRSQPKSSRDCSSASARGTEVMAPCGSDCSRRPRAATMRRACGSSNTPARQAATYSPRLWPSMDTGCTPRAIHIRASA